MLSITAPLPPGSQWGKKEVRERNVWVEKENYNSFNENNYNTNVYKYT